MTTVNIPDEHLIYGIIMLVKHGWKRFDDNEWEHPKGEKYILCDNGMPVSELDYWPTDDAIDQVIYED